MVEPGRLGLSSEEVGRRLAAHGPNQIQRERAVPPWRILGRQLRGAAFWLLIGAAVLSSIVGELADGIAISAILVVNAAVGFFQEYRSERALAALRSMTARRARVIRDGRQAVVAAANVVPGDLLLLEAGDVVAADGRIIEAHALQTNEAMLTGESLPIDKSATPLVGGPEVERAARVFAGTTVARGAGAAEVVATGMDTEIGRIAHLLASATDDETPLQRRLARTGGALILLSVGVVCLVAILGLVRARPWTEVLLGAVALAVAAVPEGLPAIVTVALAVGVQRMAAHNALVRRLPSVETLGCATVICTDKTGTLTTGVMSVRELWGRDHGALLDAAAACCDAELAPDERTGTGDPTEIALLAAAAERGIDRHAIEVSRPRVSETPFDPATKRMSILRSDGVLYVKGAFEAVVPLCIAGTDHAAEANQDMTARGLRVLAIATGTGQAGDGLELLGLAGMADPPRTEAVEAVRLARSAGIEVVMITGDHPATARAIAKELGILGPGDRAEEVVRARATPLDKLSIVRQRKSRGDVVAMTGDGVNDAPALREAHIGIAMGKTGTEVTREAADMVLADDDFATIVAAVREGRGIFDNIRKSLVYLLAGNTGELAVVLGASIAGLGLPFLPLQLLWINLVTDGLPAIALVLDPPAADVLGRPPRRPDEPMLGKAEWMRIAGTGLLEATMVLGTFAWALAARGSTEARNLAFSTLVFSELFRSFSARSETKVFTEVGLFTNARLVAVVAVSALVQIGLHHIPGTRALFGIETLTLADCALSVALGLVPLTVLEGLKLLRRAAADLAEARREG
ncbi:MAG: cation-translocating P-type ATPase [Deltaproteobacteria bacterium]|nr:cation-translocating P-type ATPase [Deltaproteobacteria bacterium]